MEARKIPFGGSDIKKVKRSFPKSALVAQNLNGEDIPFVNTRSCRRLALIMTTARLQTNLACPMKIIEIYYYIH